MTKDVLLFNGAAIPAHIAAKMAEAPTNIKEQVSVPSLITQGKGAWAIVMNGETTKLQKRDAEGDLIDMPIFRGIILGYADRRGRAYYPGAYNKDKPGKPSCWSKDGITRDAHVAEPPVTEDGEIVTKCGQCPFAVKGSLVDARGVATTACKEHRILAIIPHNKPDFTPLRLKLSITSDYDGRSPELEAEDWFAFSNYTKAMRARGVTNTAFVITKLRFDPNAEYQKIIFQWGGWVDALGEGVQDKILEVAASEEVKKIIDGTWSGDEGAAAADPDPEPAAKPKPKAKAADNEDGVVLPKTNKKPPPPADEDDDAALAKLAAKAKAKAAAEPDEADEEAALLAKLAALKAAKAKDEKVVSKPFTEDDIELTTTAKADQPKVAAKQAARKKAAEEDDGEVILPTGKGKPKQETAPKQTAQPVSKNAAALLGKWGDDDDE